MQSTNRCRTKCPHFPSKVFALSKQSAYTFQTTYERVIVHCQTRHHVEGLDWFLNNRGLSPDLQTCSIETVKNNLSSKPPFTLQEFILGPYPASVLASSNGKIHARTPHNHPNKHPTRIVSTTIFIPTYTYPRPRHICFLNRYCFLCTNKYASTIIVYVQYLRTHLSPDFLWRIARKSHWRRHRWFPCRDSHRRSFRAT